MKILFLVPYPSEKAPSQRFRFEQYYNKLVERNYTPTVAPFFSNKQWSLICSKKNQAKIFFITLKAFAKRSFVAFDILRFDIIFIHREILPIGPPVFEWIIAKVFKRKLIYDFDDAIWLTDNINESRIEKRLRWRSKVRLICKWSYKVSAGNEYLASFAKKYNANVVLNPTTLDIENQHNPALYRKSSDKTGRIIIGWTGSHSTLKYLKTLETVLMIVEERNPGINFLVIADKEPTLNLKNVEFVQWSKETEVRELARADIGLMPLPDDEWTKGKCGFKALQYMALEIPALVSPVGVNAKIVDHGINGFHCHTDDDWIKYTETLIKDLELRRKMGIMGREKVVRYYSVSSNAENFISLFE